jgi:hypothetical protein
VDKGANSHIKNKLTLYSLDGKEIELTAVNYTFSREPRPIYTIDSLPPLRKPGTLAGTMTTKYPYTVKKGLYDRIEIEFDEELNTWAGAVKRVSIPNIEVLESGGVVPFIQIQSELQKSPSLIYDKWETEELPLCGNKDCDGLCANCICMSEPQYSKPGKLLLGWKKVECECGSEACGYTAHSSWCAKYEK